jgi:hypothetical protein
MPACPFHLAAFVEEMGRRGVGPLRSRSELAERQPEPHPIRARSLATKGSAYGRMRRQWKPGRA